MAESTLEEIMVKFWEKEFDVLVSTTIVESGLDIPSANTMIVHRADRFGLAQLYQLRGRVGRSKTRAYAYLTTPPDRIVTETAENDPNTIGLCVLNPTGLFFNRGVKRDDEGGGGTWHWPERS